MGRAYYNEINPAAAHVLRALIADSIIAPGEVDERSIVDVRPADLCGFSQCHFFAGGGLWSVAARLAGWPDDRPLWTGSCPCQPFSVAGKGLGRDDPRHLWPHFHRLIAACRPAVCVGEQVAGKAGYDWLDGTRADLGCEGYACEAFDIPACAVDAPHQRNRLYWCATLSSDPLGFRRPQALGEPGYGAAAHGQGTADRLECTCRAIGGHEPHPNRCGRGGRSQGTLGSPKRGTAAERPAGELFADAASDRRGEGWSEPVVRGGWDAASGDHAFLQPDADKSFVQGQPSAGQFALAEQDARALRNGSFWSDAEWIISPVDGKARRSKPGIRFLVDGLPGRVGLWRIGGNAIVPILAAEVIGALMDVSS